MSSVYRIIDGAKGLGGWLYVNESRVIFNSVYIEVSDLFSLYISFKIEYNHSISLLYGEFNPLRID